MAGPQDPARVLRLPGESMKTDPAMAATLPPVSPAAVMTERRGAAVLITINRPGALNALNTEVLDALAAACFNQELMDGAAAVVLTGAGKAFVAGADIASMASLDVEGARRFAARGQAVFDMVAGLPIPVIAAVNGFALGGGCELTLACDIVLAAPNAVFGQPEVKLGVIPGFGGTQRLVRRVGAMRAAEMCFSGRVVKAEEAVAMGLALRIVTEGTVVAGALALADQIGAMGPVAVRLCKQAVTAATDAELHAGLLLERDLFALCFSTEDQKEGMSAFLQKRTAAFTGR